MEVVSIILAAGKGKRMNSDLPKPLHKIAGKSLMNWLGNSLDEVGLGSITDEQNDGLGGEAFIKGANDGTRLRGGFTAIVDHLAQEYSLDIRLNHVVRSIDYCEEEDRVYVHTMPYLNGKKFVAKKVIITIPFGALKWDSPTMLFSEGKAPKCIRGNPYNQDMKCV